MNRNAITVREQASVQNVMGKDICGFSKDLAMPHMTRKATRHVNQNEGLIFEKSSAGKAAWKLAPLDVPEVDTKELLGSSERNDLGNMPEVSEIEIIRHFTRLSTWNYAIDLGMYPLGSCTMKYNPRVNEAVSRLDGIANAH